MTPQEKSQELYANYHKPLLNFKGAIKPNQAIELQMIAKQCALIAVDEILKICSPTKIVYSEMVNGCLSEYTEDYFFDQVKQEIENL